MKYVALYEQALANLIGKDVNELLVEGGNLAIGSHEAQHLDLKVTSRGYMIPKLNQLLQAISKGYASMTGEELWSNKLLSSGSFLSGSSLHFFNVKGIPDETFVEKKPTVGDIDTMVDRTKEVELQQFLKAIENKKIGPATFLGFQRGNEQFSGLFELQDPPVKIQIDFEFVEFINGLPTDWARFSHSSSWEDLQSGIKGVFHKWLIRALAGLSKKTFYQRKMKGKGKLKKEEDIPVTDKMYSFAVSSKEGGGLRPKYEHVLDANDEPEYKDGIPVMRATSTAGYERDIGQIFRNLFGVRLTPQQEKKVAQKFWSFTGLLDVINSVVSPEEKQKILDDFLNITIGPGSQGMYKNNPDKDIKEKTIAIDTLLTKLGLQKPANFDEMLKNYRATYKMTADESRDDFRPKPDSIVARMAKKALGEAAPSYRRVGIQHLYNPGNSMEIKDGEFIQLCKEIMEDGGNLAGADLSLKVDGAGIRFGKDEQGKPFFMTSKVTEPKYIENYGDFEAFGRSTGQSDERLAFTKNYDEALKTILTAPFMKKLPEDTIVQAEMLFNPMAKKDSDGYTFVNIPYDPKKLGSVMTLVPIFVKQYSNGETRPDSQQIKQALIDSSDTKIKIVGTAIKNKGVNVSNIVKPIISHEAELVTALKTRGESPAKQKAKEIITRAKKSLSETIMNSDMPGKDSLGEIIEGIVIRMPNGRLLKITSSQMKDKMAAKQAAGKKSTTDSNRHKPAVVTIGSFVGHRGHQVLINHTIETANKVGGDPYVYVSPVTGSDDPVPPDVKVATLRKLFPSIADNIKVWDSAGSPVKKIEKELVLPSNSPYNKIIVMVGSDRVDGFRNWLSALEKRMKDPIALAKYGGTQNQVDYEVIGIPREEADGGNGLSFSKLRNVLKDPNKTPEEQLQAWVSGFDVSKLGTEWIKRLMDITREGMGLTEADSPNYFGGGSMSAIPGTPSDLQPRPSEEEIKAYRKEMADLKRFLRR